MILYFSGTGNSKALAIEVARHTCDEIYDISKLPLNPEVGLRVIWVFPIYSWGLPQPVVDAMKSLDVEGISEVEHFMAATCGDDAGFADKQWRRLAASRGWLTKGAYTVEMPNTYTMMKGFDVDSPETVLRKLKAFPPKAELIARAIKRSDGRNDVIRGRFAWIKSRIIYPWFMRYATSSKPFRATAACTACGKCARNCPCGTITMDRHNPQWNGQRCAMCERCYHSCPVRAIAYGKSTEGKGQYLFAMWFKNLS